MIGRKKVLIRLTIFVFHEISELYNRILDFPRHLGQIREEWLFHERPMESFPLTCPNGRQDDSSMGYDDCALRSMTDLFLGNDAVLLDMITLIKDIRRRDRFQIPRMIEVYQGFADR